MEEEEETSGADAEETKSNEDEQLDHQQQPVDQVENNYKVFVCDNDDETGHTEIVL